MCNIADKSRRLSVKEIHSTFWTNKSCNLRQIHFTIWTNIFINLSNWIWTITCCLLFLLHKNRVGANCNIADKSRRLSVEEIPSTILEKYILQFGQIHFAILANIFYNYSCLLFLLHKSRFGANGNIANKSSRYNTLVERIAESFHIQGEKNQIICRCEL